VDLDIVFLGTAGSMPTAQRAPAALLVRRGRRQAACSTAPRARSASCCAPPSGLLELEEVFVTHFHADHVLGLPGMFKTFSLRGRELPLSVLRAAGPRRPARLAEAGRRKLTYDLKLVELEPGDVLERDGYRLATFGVAHGVSALGWSLIEATRPGRFDVERADALGVPKRPERGACSAAST
jgi:ribonuclease Z